jgi:excisionase family DNA binding protein
VHVEMNKPRKPIDSVKFYWDNPPGPRQGGVIERIVRGHLYTRRIRPGDMLSPSEAALALEVRREFVYHLIWDKKLKAVKKQGQTLIPWSEVKAYAARRRRRPR